MPKIIDRIPNDCFCNCTNLTTTGIDYSKITYIGNNAFFGCSKLTEAYSFPVCREVGDKAFRGSGIRDLYLPNCISLGKFVFERCALNILYLPQLKEINEYSLLNINELNVLFIPSCESLLSLPTTNNTNIYLSETFADAKNKEGADYNIIAPKTSYAEEWATQNDYEFVDIYSGVSNEIFNLADIDCDGEATIDDYSILRSYISGACDFKDIGEKINFLITMDINMDGAIDGFDLYYLNYYINRRKFPSELTDRE